MLLSIYDSKNGIANTLCMKFLTKYNLLTLDMHLVLICRNHMIFTMFILLIGDNYIISYMQVASFQYND